MEARDKRSIGALLIFVAVAMLAALIAGAVYERIERKQDRNRLPQIGRSVDIGGRSLNIYCSGEGGPTVILDSGAPASGYSWIAVQREIARFTQACWYDRAGYGWSDPGPDPRNSVASAKDLHDLLHAARIPAPYILVAERFACFDVRVYNGRYPGEVTAAVLLDPVPDDEASNPKTRGALPQFLRHPQSLFVQALNQVGAVRLFGLGTPRRRLGPAPRGFTAQEWALIWALRNEPKTRTSLLQEVIAESIAQARAAGGFGERALVVLNSEPGAGAMQYDEPGEVVAAIRKALGR
jgi:pimeloyl-ACP methyl ester carboxylesterase